MNRTRRNFAFAASVIGVVALTGCVKRVAPVVSSSHEAQLGEYDAVIIARGIS